MPQSIEKLLEVFDVAREHESKNAPTRSLHWEKDYSQENWVAQKQNMEAISREHRLKNFRNSKTLSRGLDDGRASKLSLLKIKRFMSEAGEQAVLDNLESKNTGNPDSSIEFLGYCWDINRLHHIYFYSVLRPYINSNGLEIACEIGGGYGSFADIVLGNNDCKYILIDLPEANLLASYYLSENYPEKRLYTYDDYLNSGEVSKSDIASYDIFVLPPWVKFDDSIEIDLFVNTRSMMEMEVDVIRGYFDFIQRHASQEALFLNINRYEKRTVGHAVRISEYPYDDDWEVLVSKPYFEQPHIHILLTKRGGSGGLPVREELIKVHDLGKKYFKNWASRFWMKIRGRRPY